MEQTGTDCTGRGWIFECHSSTPSSRGRNRLQTIPGLVPGMLDRPSGCLFAPRCSHVQPLACTRAPALQQVAQHGGDCVRCHFPLKGTP